MDNEDDENNSTKRKMTAAWTFWIGVILIVVGIVIVTVIIGYMYYRLGSIKLPPECYVSNKDIRVAKQAKKYLKGFEEKKNQMKSLLCKECSPCKKCTHHDFAVPETLKIPTKS